MNRGLLGLAVLTLLTTAACGDKGGDNKTTATAETTSTAAPPPAATTAAANPPPADSGAPADKAEKGEKKAEKGEKGEKGEKAEKGEKNAKEGEEAKGEKTEKVIHLTKTKLVFDHPGTGWTESKKGVWTLLHPADKTGVLAFVEFEKPGEAGARLGEIATNLELSDVKWKGAAKKIKVGPNKLAAEHSEGSCKMGNKHEGEIEAYAVDGKALVVYAAEVDTKKADKHEMIATKTVETIRLEGEADATPAAHHKKH